MFTRRSVEVSLSVLWIGNMAVCTSRGKPILSTDSQGNRKTYSEGWSLGLQWGKPSSSSWLSFLTFRIVSAELLSPMEHLLIALLCWVTHGPYSCSWPLPSPLLTEAGQEKWLLCLQWECVLFGFVMDSLMNANGLVLWALWSPLTQWAEVLGS